MSLRFQLLGIEYPLPGTNVPKFPVTGDRISLTWSLSFQLLGIEYPLPGTNVPKVPVTGDRISLTWN